MTKAVIVGFIASVADSRPVKQANERQRAWRESPEGKKWIAQRNRMYAEKRVKERQFVRQMQSSKFNRIKIAR